MNCGASLEYACVIFFLPKKPGESSAPATKSAPDLAKVLRLPRNLHMTLPKCCACREICTRPCERAAPATKYVPGLAKVLRLPRNLNLPCLAKALPLPRNPHLTLPKVCYIRPCQSAAPATKSAPGLAKVLRLPRNTNLAKPARCHYSRPGAEPAPHPHQTGVETEVVDIAADPPKPAEGHSFSRNSIPPPHARTRSPIPAHTLCVRFL